MRSERLAWTERGCRKVLQVLSYLSGGWKAQPKPNKAPLKPIPAIEEPFSRVLIDCVGPLPKTRSGNQYLLTIMCVTTRFPEAVPVGSHYHKSTNQVFLPLLDCQDTFNLTRVSTLCQAFSSKLCTSLLLPNVNHLLTIHNRKVLLNGFARR